MADIDVQSETFLTTEELSERYHGRIAPATFTVWRKRGRHGPPFLKFGRTVLYPLSKVLEWERAHYYTSDSE